MALVFCVLLSICCFHASIGQELCGACDFRNEEHNGSCYHFSSDVANHSTANVSCQNLGFHLVAISSPEEQNFVVHHLLNAAVNHWIGLTTDEGGNRVWSDGSNVTYSNYGESEAFDDGGFCFRLRPSQNYTWYDQNCSYSYRYICERDIVCNTSQSSEAHTSPPQQTPLATPTSVAPQITTSNATTLRVENGSVATTIATAASESTPHSSTSAADFIGDITSTAASSSAASTQIWPSEVISTKSEGSTSAMSAGSESHVPTTMMTSAMPATITTTTTAEPTTSTMPSSSTPEAEGKGPTDVSSGGNSTVSTTAATSTTSTSIMTTTPTKRARMGCTNFRLVADDSTLTDDALVRTWYTVSSVIGCAQRCLDDVSCSVFTFIALERVCLLGEMHDRSGSFYELRIGATTYSVV